MTNSYPIEIKVNIGGDVEQALAALGLGEGKPREVWFLDDLTDGLDPALPLLNAGVVIRLRRRHNGREESTVKLRPCRRSQLLGHWGTAPADDEHYRIEGDWSRKRHALAASCDAALRSGAIDGALGDGGQTEDLVDDRQRDFLAECAQIGVAVGALSAVGRHPIAATQWKGVSIGRMPAVDAERWIVDGLDFLEVSCRSVSGAEDAAKLQHELEQEVASRGLAFDTSERPKTERAMRRLAGLD